MFYLSPTCFEAQAIFFFFSNICFPAKLVGLSCVGCWLFVINVSNRTWCFAARTDPKLLLINVSDRPWCFVARSNRIFVVEVSDEFSTGLEVLLIYLVICFESLYCVVQAVPA